MDGIKKTNVIYATDHNTTCMFGRYNTIDQDDAKEAVKRLEEYIDRLNYFNFTSDAGEVTRTHLPGTS